MGEGVVDQSKRRGRRADPEVVVITGASAGVGRATAVEFARRGARVALLARDVDRLERARRDVESAGGEALIVQADVSDSDAVERAATTVEEAFGPIDVWVNNAMVSVFSPFTEMTAEEFRRVTEVTYLGYVHGTKAALLRMRGRDRGTIVQVGSALAYRGIPLQSAYCGAKHAIQGFTESVRAELFHEKSRVHITMVQLPALNTPQFSWVRTRLPRHPLPVPPIYQPQVAARAIHWAAHHKRRELNVGGSTAITLLGNKILPGFGDRYLGRTGYDAQQTEDPVHPERPDNLWTAPPGDFGTEGVFSDRAHPRSAQLWATTHRRSVLMAGAGIAAALLALRGRGS